MYIPDFSQYSINLKLEFSRNSGADSMSVDPASQGVVSVPDHVFWICYRPEQNTDYDTHNSMSYPYSIVRRNETNTIGIYLFIIPASGGCFHYEPRVPLPLSTILPNHYIYYIHHKLFKYTQSNGVCLGPKLLLNLFVSHSHFYCSKFFFFLKFLQFSILFQFLFNFR